MSIVRAYDVAFVRFRAPDLPQMQAFLQDFGMLDAQPEKERLFMRGYGSNPFLHVTERSETAGFVGFGIWVKDESDLQKIADHDGLPVLDLDAPGGGKVVRLVDPDGFVVEVVAGQTKAEPEPVTLGDRLNQVGAYARDGIRRRVDQGRSHIMRLGHLAIAVTDFRRSEAWYKERFGFVTSDEIEAPNGEIIGAFVRCDRDGEPCDHHTIFLLGRPGDPGFLHSAFEVVDLDDLMTGHDYLKRAGRDHFWGVGRHYLGSQVFDYWKDPWGHEIEHWTDGDRLFTADGGGVGVVAELMGVQWGMQMPPIPGVNVPK